MLHDRIPDLFCPATEQELGIGIEYCLCRSSLGPHVPQPYSTDENENEVIKNHCSDSTDPPAERLIFSSLLLFKVVCINFMMAGFKDLFAALLLSLRYLRLIVEVPLSNVR